MLTGGVTLDHPLLATCRVRTKRWRGSEGAVSSVIASCRGVPGLGIGMPQGILKDFEVPLRPCDALEEIPKARRVKCGAGHNFVKSFRSRHRWRHRPLVALSKSFRRELHVPLVVRDVDDPLSVPWGLYVSPQLVTLRLQGDDLGFVLLLGLSLPLLLQGRVARSLSLATGGFNRRAADEALLSLVKGWVRRTTFRAGHPFGSSQNDDHGSCPQTMFLSIAWPRWPHHRDSPPLFGGPCSRPRTVT
jgi:hypothetical protein